MQNLLFLMWQKISINEKVVFVAIFGKDQK